MTPSAMTVSPEKEVSSYLEQARAFTIKSLDDLAMVDAHCAAGLALKKKIEADFAESKSAAHGAWKAIVAQEKGHLDGIDEGRKFDKGLIDAWNVEQKRLADEQAAIAQAAEKLRLEDEALSRATRAAEFGDDKTAEAIISAPIVTTPAKAYEAPKTSTIFQTRWDYEVIDASLIPREYLQVNTVALGSVVRSTKGALNIPGIRQFSKKV